MSPSTKLPPFPVIYCRCSRLVFEQIGVRVLVSPSTHIYMAQHKSDRGVHSQRQGRTRNTLSIENKRRIKGEHVYSMLSRG